MTETAQESSEVIDLTEKIQSKIDPTNCPALQKSQGREYRRTDLQTLLPPALRPIVAHYGEPDVTADPVAQFAMAHVCYLLCNLTRKALGITDERNHLLIAEKVEYTWRQCFREICRNGNR